MKARPVQLLIGIGLIVLIGVGLLPAATPVNATSSAAALVTGTNVNNPADSGSIALIDDPIRLFLPLVLNNPQLLPLPVLIGPQDGAVLDTLIPLFQWDMSVQPADTSSCLVFSTIQHSTICQAGGFASSGPHELIAWFNLSPSTIYYWRVGAVYNNDYDHPNWSEERSFTTGPAGGIILPAPILVSPANDISVPPNNPVPTLNWNAVAGAVAYSISLHDIDRNDWYGLDTYATQMTLNWPALYPLTHYEWYVVARNDYAWGTSSATWQFVTTAGSAAQASSEWAADFVRVNPGGALVNVIWKK